MANLICRYLFDEGAGTTLADSSGNGYDLTITTGGGGGWTTLDGGNGWQQGDRTAGSKAQSETAHLAFDGLAQVTAVMVLQDMNGNSGMPRAWFIGQSGGNGKISTNVGVDRYESRWMREPNDDNHIRVQWGELNLTVGGFEQYHVLICEYEPLAVGTASDKLRAWLNNTKLVDTQTQRTDPMIPLDIISTDRFCLFNRPAQNNGALGKYGYFEAWDGLLTAQEKTDATTNLLADCNTAWDGGGPPTSVSFTSEPSATNIDTDRVTANATAESDAIDEGEQAYDSLWNHATESPIHVVDSSSPASNLGTIFTPSVNGKVHGASFYRHAEEVETGSTGRLWTSGGSLLASSPEYVGNATETWVDLMFAAPVDVVAGTDYVISVNPGHGGANLVYSREAGYFDSALSSPPLSAPITAGVYSDASSATFPGTPSASNTSFFRDVLFVAD